MDEENSNEDVEPTNYDIVNDLNELLLKEGLKEIGSQAVWSVSSCKHGLGVNLLRDNDLETYWQSDGIQPHMVNIQFRQKTTLHSVGVYADYKLDESYTPSRLSVRVGNDFNDLHEIELVDVLEPSGWVWIKLNTHLNPKPVRTFMAQISIIQNHQNGRDTHLRQIKVFASATNSVSLASIVSGKALPIWNTAEAGMFATIR